MFIFKLNPEYEDKTDNSYIVKHFLISIASASLMLIACDLNSFKALIFASSMLFLPYPYIYAIRLTLASFFKPGLIFVPKDNIKSFLLDKKIDFIKDNLKETSIFKKKVEINTIYHKNILIDSLKYKNSHNIALQRQDFSKDNKDFSIKLGFRRITLSSKALMDNLVYLGAGFVWTPLYLKESQKFFKDGFNFNKTNRHGSCEIHALSLNNTESLCFRSDDLCSHTLIFGTTGSGKTRFYDLLTTQAIMRGECVIVIDPKGDRDLRNTLKNACNLFRDTNDFLELDFLHEKTSISLNPLTISAKDTAIAQRIASLIQGTGSAESFKSAAFQALCASVATLRLSLKEVTLLSIRDTLVNHDNFANALFEFIKNKVTALQKTDVSDFYERLYKGIAKTKAYSKIISPENCEKIYSYMVKKGYIDYDASFYTIKNVALYSRDYYQKMTAIVHPILNTLNSGHLSKILSAKGVSKCYSMREIIDKKKVLYVPLYCLSDATLGSYLGKLLLSSLADCAGDIYARDDKGDRVSIYVDEASELADEPLVQLLNKARGANFALTVATQSYDDLVKRTGSQSSANQIIANCNSLIALRVLDENSAKVICSRMPKSQVQRISTSNNYSLSETNEISTGTTRSKAFVESPLVFESLLMNLPDLEFFAKLANSKVIKGQLPLFK